MGNYLSLFGRCFVNYDIIKCVFSSDNIDSWVAIIKSYSMYLQHVRFMTIHAGDNPIIRICFTGYRSDYPM